MHDKVAGARFTIVASALTAPLFAEVPGLERVIVMEKRPLGLHWPTLWNEVRGRAWGLIVDLRGSPISSFLSRKRRAVLAQGRTRRRTRWSRPRACSSRSRTRPGRISTWARRTARAPPRSPPARARSWRWRPSANWVGKMWPVERFAQVARALLGAGGELEGGRLMVVGGPGDRAVAGPLLSALPKERRIDLVDKAPLLTIAAALAKARLFIGNNSGLMHLSAAAGAPTLGLFGPSDENRYTPWGEHTAVARGPRSFAQIQAQDPRLDHQVCHMTDLSASAVLRAARTLLAQSEPAHA